MPTRTGSYSVGFRRGWSEWQRDLGAMARWAKGAGFEHLDLGACAPAELEVVKGAGLGVGSVDLHEIGKIVQADAGARKELTARNVELVRTLAALGVKAFFLVIIPDPPMTRAEGMRVAVEALGPVCEEAARWGAALVLEGWPGPAPQYPALGTTPETCRVLLRELGAGMALNYDPSHLVRLGVDPIRFAGEFAGRVRHVHAKDTALYPEAVYELGLYQGSVMREGFGYGEHVWRYTIPGQGVVNWCEALRVLKAGGFEGKISVELEDEHFNGSEGGEKHGLELALAYLRGV